MRTCDSAPPLHLFSSRYSYQRCKHLTASRISREVGSYEYRLTPPRTVSDYRMTATLSETEMQVRGIFADADAVARRKVR